MEDLIEEEDVAKKNIIITGDHYQLRQVSDDSHLWNLYLKRRRKKKDGTEQDVWVCSAYGVVIRQAIPMISNFMIAKGLNGKAVTLKQYLQLWLKVSQKILNELHGL